MRDQQLLNLGTMATGYKRSNPAAYKIARGWQERIDLARSCLHKVAKKMKK